MRAKFIRPDMATIPDEVDRITCHAVVEEPLVDRWLQEIGETEWAILVDDCDHFHMDAGGIVNVNEPKIENDFDGFEVSLLLRHADVFLPMLNDVRDAVVGPHVWIPGHWVKGLFTVDSGKAIAEWLAAEIESKRDEAEAWWDKHYREMRSIGVHVPPRVK